MRGQTAQLGDFYFGSNASTTAATENPGGVQADPTASPNGNPTTLGAVSQPTPAAAGKAINPINLVPGLSGVNPLWAIPIILGLLVIGKIVRELGHKSSDFQTVKVDLYWFGMTVAASIAGIPLVKAIANKYPIQPITDYINNA